MANEKVNIKASAKTVANDKTKLQEEEYLKAKERKAEADKKAKESVKESAPKEKKKEADNSKALEAIAAGLSNSVKRGGSFLKGIILGLIFGIILTCVVGVAFKDEVFKTLYSTKEEMDAFIDENFFGYTGVDFKEAILGEAEEHQELIVMEQPIEVNTTLTKSGLGNLEIFSKTKDITYKGTGVFTVDFKNLDEKHVDVDENKKVITIKVPKATLQYVNIDYEGCKFNDTEKGILAFGDLHLTVEEQNDLEILVQKTMREELSKAETFEKANEYAKMKTWETFQPVISKMSPSFVVEVELY